MKKLSKRHSRRLVWRAKVRFEIEIRRRRLKINRLRDTGYIKGCRNVKPSALLLPPRDFTFETNYEGVVSYISELRAKVAEIKPNSRDHILADLSTIEKLCPSAAICLVAEMERWQRISKKRLYPHTVSKWSADVRANLYSLGFFGLLGTRLPVAFRQRKETDDCIWLPFSSAILVQGAIPKKLRHKIEGALGSIGHQKSVLYKPMIEAIKNAVEHAYPREFNSKHIEGTLGSRWWLLGVVNKNTRKISIIVYDQGVTIPASLPSNNWWEGAKKIIHGRPESDSLQIEAAVEYGKTRTGLEERGKGLADIVAIAHSDVDNHVQIYSRWGRYHSIGTEVQNVPQSPVPLSGTLIRWDVCL